MDEPQKVLYSQVYPQSFTQEAIQKATCIAIENLRASKKKAKTDSNNMAFVTNTFESK